MSEVNGVGLQLYWLSLTREFSARPISRRARFLASRAFSDFAGFSFDGP